MSRLIPAYIVALALIPAACVTQSDQTYLRPIKSQVDQAFVKPGADFSRYSKLKSGELGIYYPDNVAPPSDAELNRIRAIFRDAFKDALSDRYEIVDAAGPDVLEVRAQIIDMKVAGAGGDFAADGRLRDLVARGEMTFLMELRDSVSGESLARAGDKTTDISAPGEIADWGEVERAANHWAELFRNWLDRSLGAGNQR
jgi:hypothetical protein